MAFTIDSDIVLQPEVAASATWLTAAGALDEVSEVVSPEVVAPDTTGLNDLAHFAIEHSVSSSDIAVVRANADLRDATNAAQHFLVEGRLAQERGGIRALPHRTEQALTMLMRPLALRRARRTGILQAAAEIVQNDVQD